MFYSLVCNTQLFCTFQRVAETMNVEGEVSLLIDSPSPKGASAKKTSGQEKGQTDRKTATKVSRHMLGYVTKTHHKLSSLVSSAIRCLLLVSKVASLNSTTAMIT